MRADTTEGDLEIDFDVTPRVRKGNPLGPLYKIIEAFRNKRDISLEYREDWRQRTCITDWFVSWQEDFV